MFAPALALLVITMLPLTLPEDAGANVTFSKADWPGIKTVPADTPEALKPAPAIMTLEIVTAPVPELVSVATCAALFETVTVPKLSEAALEVSTKVEAGVGV